jgi:uncharacterized membrane protein
MVIAIQILLILGVPALLMYAEKRVKLVEWVGPVILCYLTGMLAAALPIWEPDNGISNLLSGVSAILAIPLVLFSTNLQAWKRLAGKTLLSFALCLVASLVATFVAYQLIGKSMAEGRELAGMTVGVYTGGTVNLNIIAKILGSSPELIGKANLADLVVSSVYLLLLFTVMQRIALLFLPAFQKLSGQAAANVEQQDENLPKGLGGWAKALLLGAVVGGGSLALGELAGMLIPFGNPKDQQMLTYTIALLAVTLIALWLSNNLKIRNMPGTFLLGEYFLLAFCVAIGLMIDVRELTNMAEIADLLAFMAIAIYGAIILHFVLARFFKIDADTAIITSVAAVFSPVFVPPIARVMKNKEIITSGMTTGVIGFVLGSFLGLGLWWVL